jgi:hypothetical protein
VGGWSWRNFLHYLSLSPWCNWCWSCFGLWYNIML